MTAPKPLTRKLGPLPVWAWAAVVVGAYLAYRRYRGSDGGSPTSQGTPVVPNVGSAAQQPSGGQGTAADNSSSDLLSALGANTQAADALLAAVQGAAAGGGLGVTAGTGTSGGSSSAAAAAASADTPPADTTPTDTAASPSSTTTTTSTQSQTIPLPGIAYIETETGIAPAPSVVSSPTPTVVQPAPVYTEGVIAKPGIAYAA